MTSDKPIKEYVFRLYEKPVGKNKDDIARIACLSCGLIDPFKHNYVIPEILVILNNKRKFKEWIGSQILRKDLINSRNEKKLSLKGTSYPNIRRSLKLLRDFGFVEKEKAKYRIKNFKSLDEVFEDIVCNDINKVFYRVKEYLKCV
ncbi:MAG: hypothetical protein ACQER9_02035 [Nanobdellota archaeon]